jgi:hypothetical protein
MVMFYREKCHPMQQRVQGTRGQILTILKLFCQPFSPENRLQGSSV